MSIRLEPTSCAILRRPSRPRYKTLFTGANALPVSFDGTDDNKGSYVPLDQCAGENDIVTIDSSMEFPLYFPSTRSFYIAHGVALLLGSTAALVWLKTKFSSPIIDVCVGEASFFGIVSGTLVLLAFTDMKRQMREKCHLLVDWKHTYNQWYHLRT